MLNISGRKSEISEITESFAWIDIQEALTPQRVSDTPQCKYGAVRFPENVEYFWVDRLIFLKVLKFYPRINI